MKNTWHKNQPRTAKSTFKPKWTPKTIEWMMAEVKKGTEDIDIQYQLIKDYEISHASSKLWLEMAKRTIEWLKQGMTLEEAIDHDRKWRNKNYKTGS